MKAFDIGRNTLRLYEEMGLLSEMPRTESGYREYSTEHFEELKFIKEAKQVGFTLNEIKNLLETLRTQNKMTCGTVSSEISEKVSEIETSIKTLESKKLFLKDFLSTCKSKSEDTACNVVNTGFTKNACC